jgi:hypothetical protein
MTRFVDFDDEQDKDTQGKYLRKIDCLKGGHSRDILCLKATEMKMISGSKG